MTISFMNEKEEMAGCTSFVAREGHDDYDGMADKKLHRMMAVNRYREKRRRRRKMVVVLKKTEKRRKDGVREADKKKTKKKSTTTVQSTGRKKKNEKVQEEDGLLPWVDAAVCPSSYYTAFDCQGGLLDSIDSRDYGDHHATIPNTCVFDHEVYGTRCENTTNAVSSSLDMGWDHLFRTDSVYQCSIEAQNTNYASGDCHSAGIDNFQPCTDDAMKQGDVALLKSEEQTTECEDDWVRSVLNMEQLDTKGTSHRGSNKMGSTCGRKKANLKQKENLAVNKMEKKKRPSTRNAKRGRGRGGGTVREGKKHTAVQEKKEEDVLIYVDGVCDASLYEYEYVQKREDGSKSNVQVQQQQQLVEAAHKDNDGLVRSGQKSLPDRFPKKRAGQKNAKNGNARKGRKEINSSASLKRRHGIRSKKDGGLTLPSNGPSGAKRRGDGSSTSTWNTLSHEESSAENRARSPVLYANYETKPFRAVGPFPPMSGFGVPILLELQQREQ